VCRPTQRIDDVVPQRGRKQGEQIASGCFVLELAPYVLLEDIPREIFNRQTDASDRSVMPTESKVGKGSPGKCRQAEGQFAKIHVLLLRQVRPPGQLDLV